MKSRNDLSQYLRDHIVGALHVGQLRSGDRLPSIRELGRQLGRNTRTIRAAFAKLQQEGLIEVRGRSGVFVVPQEIPGAETLEETAHWLSTVVAEASKRRIAVHALPPLIRRFTATRRISCGLVEVVKDSIVALQHELETEWGFDVHVVAPDALARARHLDFFATTSFYAPAIHAEVESFGKPLIVVTIHSALKEAVKARIEQGSLTVVAVDSRFAERIRVAYAADDPGRIRFMLARDRKAVEQLDPAEPVLLTRAASRELGTVRVPLIFPHSPTISWESARALATLLVRRNAEVIRTID